MFDMLRPRKAQPMPTETITESKPTRLTGSIRALKAGFGFIAADDGEDYFFHWSAMDPDSKDFRMLSLRERVSFKVEQSDRGARAVEVVVIQRTT